MTKIVPGVAAEHMPCVATFTMAVAVQRADIEPRPERRLRLGKGGQTMSKEKQIDKLRGVLWLNPYVCLGSHNAHMLAQYLHNEGYRKQSEWISVHDRLPALGENVLCFENGKFYIAFFEKFEEGAWWDWVAYDRDDTWLEVCPTDWMPLPEPPKGE